MKESIITQVLEQLQELPENLQRKVLDFVQSLKAQTDNGMKGKELLVFAGAISGEDLKAMQEAIDKDCETIDENEW